MCDAGYGCELNSPSSRKRNGRVNKFCPSGSFAPTFVSEGYYTVGGGPGVNDESGSEETRHVKKNVHNIIDQWYSNRMSMLNMAQRLDYPQVNVMVIVIQILLRSSFPLTTT